MTNPSNIAINGVVSGIAFLARPKNKDKDNDNTCIRGEYREDLPDYTDAINEMLEREERNYKTIGLLAEAARIIDRTGAIAEAIKYGYFYMQEKTNDRLDIKQKDKWNVVFGDDTPYLDYPYDKITGERRGDFIYVGMAINAAELGNIAYGYLGKTLEFSDVTLYYGGGFARLKAEGKLKGNIFNELIANRYFGDKPEGIEDIMKGIILYNKTHGFGCNGGAK